MSTIETLSIPALTHGRVLVRRAASPSSAVLAGFHGYGENAAEGLARLVALPGAEGWTLVSIQGLNRFYRRRTQETVAGWMTREDRLAAIADNVAYVNAALDAAVAGPVDALVFAGFSQGVAMAFRAAVHGRRRADGIIAVGGDVPPELLERTDTRFPAVLLLRGRTDEWYTADRLGRDADAIAARGAAVQATEFDGGHEWPQGLAGLAEAFLDRFVSRSR